MNYPGVLKAAWWGCGVIGTAILCWCFWMLQTQENVLGDMIWLMLCGVMLLASAYFFYRVWEKSPYLNSIQDQKILQSRQGCSVEKSVNFPDNQGE